MCVGVVCDVGMEMDVLPKLHDRLWLLVATTHTPPPQVNEAFAAQYLAVEKDLGLDRAKTNVNGGAIALGHPLAASGSGITAHLVHEMKRRNEVFHWIGLHRRGTRHSHLMCTDGRHHLENIICMHGTSYQIALYLDLEQEAICKLDHHC